MSHIPNLLLLLEMTSNSVLKYTLQNKYSEKNTYYVFNHIEITISYHSGMNTDWGEEFGWSGGRIVAAKLEPKRYLKLFIVH